MRKVAIIDYMMGNLFSVQHACRKVGLEPVITNDAKVLGEADAVILPGVGSFGESIKSLEKLDLISPIKDFIDSKKPFMGICLGYQLLFTESEEFGNFKGMDIFEGTVKKFPYGEWNNNKIKVPQIGWNQIYPYKEDTWKTSPLLNIKTGEFVYFVHSYFVETGNDSIKLSKTIYEGFEYCSSIKKDNIFAAQFHPEKSATEGIKIYQNWSTQIKQKEL